MPSSPSNQDPHGEKWLERFREFFEITGESLPDHIAKRRPFIYVDVPVDDWARRVAEILHGRNILFRRGHEIGTVSERGEWEPMDADRFRSWLPGVAGIIPFKGTNSGDGQPIKTSLPREVATAILKADELKTKLPELVHISQVQLPVLRAELDERGLESRRGFRKIELLPEGYDAEAKTYTIHSSVAVNSEMDENEGFRFIHDLLKYFAFSDPERMACQVAAMLTVFAKGLFQGRSPMFLWNSNLPGSGKSRLSQLCLHFIYGPTGKSGYSYDSREEVRKELDAAAQANAPVVWFDDVPKGTIRSTDLNRWLTGETWQCRILGTSRLFNGPVYAATFMTGAQIELDNMIARRTLVVDLFPRQRSRNRALPEDAVVLNDAFFRNEETRSTYISALWSLVRWWDTMGRPGLKDLPATKGESPLESFEDWSVSIPPIVATANFGNCLKPFVAPDSGDTETLQWEKLAEVLIRRHALKAATGQAECNMEDVVRAARQNNLFLDHLFSIDDIIKDLEARRGHVWELPSSVENMEDDDEGRKEKAVEHWKRHLAAGWMDKRLQSSWGKRFRKSAVNGQYFEVDGEVWEFGSRTASRGVRFPMRRVADPNAAGNVAL